MKVETGLGEVELNDEYIKHIQPRNGATNVRAEVERIVGCAMQYVTMVGDGSVSERIAVSKITAESIRQVTGGRIWL